MATGHRCHRVGVRARRGSNPRSSNSVSNSFGAPSSAAISMMDVPWWLRMLGLAPSSSMRVAVDKLLVMQRDVQRRPSGRAAGNRSATIGGVDVRATCHQSVDHGETFFVLADAAMRARPVPTASGPMQRSLAGPIELIGIRSASDERSNCGDVAAVRRLPKRVPGFCQKNAQPLETMAKARTTADKELCNTEFMEAPHLKKKKPEFPVITAFCAPRGLHHRVHVVEIFLERPPADRGQTVIGAGRPAGERFLTLDVAGSSSRRRGR